jgi:hypothetical protein
MMTRHSRQSALAIVLGVMLCGLTAAPHARAPAQSSDPLPSWNDGPVKQRLQAFVAAVGRPGSNYVKPEDRIAVFDNDGTLWSEQPIYTQLAFVVDRIKAMAPSHPEWKTTEPFASILRGDLAGALTSETRIAALLAATHAGMTTDAFARTVSDWMTTARHPRTGRLYTQMVYQPMLELLAYLRANGFKTFVVSGGGVDFMRPWTEAVYGIPPEQVVGSMGKTKLAWVNGKPVLVKLAAVDFVDDKEGKPVGIHQFIGRRPILAFGNSDGDQQMLEWTAAGNGPRLVGLVHHTDAVREVAYDRRSSIGKLDKALDEATAKGWIVVSMKDDWKRVFPAGSQSRP